MIRYFKENLKTSDRMSLIDDKRKFKRKVEQSNPTNPTGNVNIDTNKYDINEKTIKDQQNKK